MTREEVEEEEEVWRSSRSFAKEFAAAVSRMGNRRPALTSCCNPEAWIENFVLHFVQLRN